MNNAIAFRKGVAFPDTLNRRVALARFALDRAAIALMEGRIGKPEIRARVLFNLDALERIAPLPPIHGVPARHHLTLALDCLDHGLCDAKDFRNIVRVDLDAIEAAHAQAAN